MKSAATLLLSAILNCEVQANITDVGCGDSVTAAIVGTSISSQDIDWQNPQQCDAGDVIASRSLVDTTPDNETVSANSWTRTDSSLVGNESYLKSTLIVTASHNASSPASQTAEAYNSYEYVINFTISQLTEYSLRFNIPPHSNFSVLHFYDADSGETYAEEGNSAVNQVGQLLPGRYILRVYGDDGCNVGEFGFDGLACSQELGQLAKFDFQLNPQNNPDNIGTTQVPIPWFSVGFLGMSFAGIDWRQRNQESI